MVIHEKIIDFEDPKFPNLKNIAKELEKKIEMIQSENNVKLISACFLGINDVLIDEEEDSIFCHAVLHDKSCNFMLFFCDKD